MLGYGIPNLQLALDNVLGINTKAKLTFRVFPNPVEDRLHIDFPENIEQATIIIYDILGKQVVKKRIKVGESSINLSQLPSGIYLAKLVGSHQNISSFKLIKQ